MTAVTGGYNMRGLININ